MASNKIGILTYYYSNYNYGGQLQAFALQKKLSNLEFLSEQICYKSTSSRYYYSLHGIDKIRHLLFDPYEVIINRFVNPNVEKRLRPRIKNFNEFRDSIPHSDVIYNDQNLSQANDEYVAFVCGSDQIWKDWGVNSEEEKRNYLFRFAKKNKVILSYAVSLGTTILSDEYQKIIKEELKKFNAISMREKSAVELIAPLTEKKVVEVLDPVFLLNAEEWKICAREPKTNCQNEEFVFAYFLGDNKQQRQFARKYAKKMHCRLVTIPYAAHHKFIKSDKQFGDIRDYEAGPREFLWYIENAKVILTDSFHAMSFSTIFHKSFYVFLRDTGGQKSMNDRITDFLNNVGLTSRLINDNFVLNEEQLDYSVYDREMQNRKSKSIEFITSNLKDGLYAF